MRVGGVKKGGGEGEIKRGERGESRGDKEGMGG